MRWVLIIFFFCFGGMKPSRSNDAVDEYNRTADYVQFCLCFDENAPKVDEEALPLNLIAFSAVLNDTEKAAIAIKAIHQGKLHG